MPMNSQTVGKQTRNFHHAVDARWLMAYAAALGERAPAYFDTTGGIVGHPVFPVCVEWPVVLDVRNIEGARSMTAEEGARGVHASHDLYVHRLVRPGDELHTRATIIGVESRKPGAYQIMRLETVDADGAPVATTHQGGLSRGVAVTGGERHVGEWPAAAVRPERSNPVPGPFSIEVLAGAAHVYTECARIWNPIHTDRAVALKAGLPDIILHGTASLALAVSTLVNELFGGDPGVVERVACRFAAMVLMPSTLRLVVEAQSADGVWYHVLNEAGEDAIRDGFVGVRR